VVIEPLPPRPEGAQGGGCAGRVWPDNRTQAAEARHARLPGEAKNARLEGLVLLEAVVGKDGRVRDVKVTRGEPWA